MNIDLSNKSAFLVLAVLLSTLLAFMHWDGQFLQYLFYLRVPLIAGALLFLLPVICIYLLPSMLANLFVLSSPLRLALVSAGGFVVALGIVLIGAVIGANADERFGLQTVGWLQALAQPDAIMPYLLAGFLAFPNALGVFLSSGSASGEMSDKARKNGALLGLGLSLGFLVVVYWIRANNSTAIASDLLIGLVSFFPEQARAGYVVNTPEGVVLANGHGVMAAYLLAALLFYVIGLFLFRPKAEKGSRQLPAISYVLGLLQTFSLILGLLTFSLDFYRVPVLLSMLAVSALSYRLWKVDHYYDLKHGAGKPPKSDEIFKAAVRRLSHQANEKTLVVVCASGGGIQAAGWTTMVLTGLQQQLGKEFTKAIGLISAVSGGSVGTLHFLDRFGADGAPDEDQFEPIFMAATQDSLGATGWGLVYPDLWRFIGAPFLKTRPRDRGAAINLDWKGQMLSPNATLGGWRDAIKQGDMPVPVFNATIVEDGRHYLISPMTFGLQEEEGLEFNGLYPQYDIDASTSALLSATFPYVTPVSRNSSLSDGDPIFHVADGGYFDNFGVVTAIDYLDRLVLPADAKRQIKKVYWVEIRAFPDEKPLKTAKDKFVGWQMALFGPIFTIFGARNSTQSQRNGDDVRDLKEKWRADGVEIEDFRIAFPDDVKFFDLPTQTGKAAKVDQYFAKLESEELEAKRYEPPLSWKLSKKQRTAIREAWDQVISDPNSGAYQLISAWSKAFPK